MRILFCCVAAFIAATSAPLGAQVYSAGNPRDPQLQELVAEAARNSPEIRAAGNERLASQYRVSPAGALDDPMLEAGVLNAPLNSLRLNREDMTMKMLGLSQKFPFPGKRDLRQERRGEGRGSSCARVPGNRQPGDQGRQDRVLRARVRRRVGAAGRKEQAGSRAIPENFRIALFGRAREDRRTYSRRIPSCRKWPTS